MALFDKCFTFRHTTWRHYGWQHYRKLDIIRRARMTVPTIGVGSTRVTLTSTLCIGRRVQLGNYPGQVVTCHYFLWCQLSVSQNHHSDCNILPSVVFLVCIIITFLRFITFLPIKYVETVENSCYDSLNFRLLNSSLSSESLDSVSLLYLMSHCWSNWQTILETFWCKFQKKFLQVMFGGKL